MLFSNVLISRGQEARIGGEAAPRSASGIAKRWFGILAIIYMGSCQLIAQTDDNCSLFKNPSDVVLPGAGLCPAINYAQWTETHQLSGDCFQEFADGSEVLIDGPNPLFTRETLKGACNVLQPDGMTFANCPPSVDFQPENSHGGKWRVADKYALNAIVGFYPCLDDNVHYSANLWCPYTTNTCICGDGPPCMGATCNPNTKKWEGCQCPQPPPCQQAECDDSTGKWKPETCPKQCTGGRPCPNAKCDTSTGNWDTHDCACATPRPCFEAKCSVGQWDTSQCTGCGYSCVNPILPPCSTASCNSCTGFWEGCDSQCPGPQPRPVCVCELNGTTWGWNCNQITLVCQDTNGNYSESCCNGTTKPSCANAICRDDGTWKCTCTGDPPCQGAYCDANGQWNKDKCSCQSSTSTTSTTTSGTGSSGSCCTTTPPTCVYGVDPTCHDDGSWTCDCLQPPPCVDATCNQDGSWSGCDDCPAPTPVCDDGTDAICVDGIWECSPDGDICTVDPCNLVCAPEDYNCDDNTWWDICGYCPL